MKLKVIGTTHDEWVQALLGQFPKQANKRSIILIGTLSQLALTMCARIIGYRVIWLSNNAEHNTLVQRLLKLMSSIAQKIIIPNQKAEAYYLKLGIASNKLTYLYPVCDFMAPKKPNEEYLTLACDGSIAVDESLGSLLRGVLLANEILGNIKLIIAGDISNKHAIEWSSQQLGIKNIIQIIPSKNNTWTKSCDVYVLLNTVNQSAPLSLIQAMAFAKPVIATNTLSNHEFIQQNNNGVLIKEINADMLSQAIINLSRKPEWMAELGKNNYNFAKEKFSDEVLQEKLSNILQ
ncbi:hypothetical protein CL632_01655 [bacterium]|jgi:hypothetical protein|nr:hypothetical protein [bacterium]|tara:strand:+ start:6124 stop:6999 length:876 start_codon:yes stop_codon:yes gene_type:complete